MIALLDSGNNNILMVYRPVSLWWCFRWFSMLSVVHTILHRYFAASMSAVDMVHSDNVQRLSQPSPFFFKHCVRLSLTILFLSIQIHVFWSSIYFNRTFFFLLSQCFNVWKFIVILIICHHFRSFELLSNTRWSQNNTLNDYSFIVTIFECNFRSY